MAHVVEAGHYFLFRTKDIHSKGLVGNFNFPDGDSFDISVEVMFNDPYGTKFISVKSITGITTPTKGMVVYLTEEESSYKIGPYIYNGTKWEPFSGEVKA